jgi:hypothetical protein
MRIRNWAVLALVAGLTLAVVPSAMAEGVVKAPRSVFNMFYVSTFTNFFGFLDHAVIWSCSLLSIGLIIENVLTVRKTTLLPELSVAQINTMFEERQFREALEYCQTDPSFVSSVVHAGLVEAANGYDAMEKAMESATNERTARL